MGLDPLTHRPDPKNGGLSHSYQSCTWGGKGRGGEWEGGGGGPAGCYLFADKSDREIPSSREVTNAAERRRSFNEGEPRAGEVVEGGDVNNTLRRQERQQKKETLLSPATPAKPRWRDLRPQFVSRENKGTASVGGKRKQKTGDVRLRGPGTPFVCGKSLRRPGLIKAGGEVSASVLGEGAQHPLHSRR